MHQDDSGNWHQTRRQKDDANDIIHGADKGISKSDEAINSFTLTVLFGTIFFIIAIYVFAIIGFFGRGAKIFKNTIQFSLCIVGACVAWAVSQYIYSFSASINNLYSLQGFWVHFSYLISEPIRFLGYLLYHNEGGSHFLSPFIQQLPPLMILGWSIADILFWIGITRGLSKLFAIFNISDEDGYISPTRLAIKIFTLKVLLIAIQTALVYICLH